MPPRLSHKKSRLGCKRCKQRKVKCDETRPRCLACARHGVSCEYPNVSNFQTDQYGESHSDVSTDRRREHVTELRLMHEWMAYVCESLPTWEFWKFQAPIVAFKYRYLLDALLAMSALHSSRQKPRTWMSLEGRMVAMDDDPNAHSSATVSTPNSEPSTGTSRSWKGAKDMLAESAIDGNGTEGGSYVETIMHNPRETMLLSRKYFDNALEGFQQAVAEMSAEKMQGLYMTSVLVSYYSLFILSDGYDGQDFPAPDPIQWFRICRGMLHLVVQWHGYIGNSWITQAGGMYGEPDLTDRDQLFRPINRQPFEYLLSPVQDDRIVPEDLVAYEETLSYIGLIYKGVVEKTDSPFATCRRVVAMPSITSDRFAELIETSQPRAYVILIHMFATLKLVGDEFPWFNGIAERLVPLLCSGLPPQWSEMAEWPLRVARGEERPDLPGDIVIDPQVK